MNELRRNTSNEFLAKRAKELVKKWRDMVLPDTNGQLKTTHVETRPPEDTQSKKRSAKDLLESANVKRTRINGQISELDFSDNSNSSFKDATSKSSNKSIIVINSDSNSSLPDAKHEPILEQQQPKKRGRKKGSKNHKNLVEEAETSFSNKLNVSRGNAKVKTTQELLADLHIKSGNAAGKPIQDLNERAAKLTERVSIIDQKLNANSRYKHSTKKLMESGVVSNIKTPESKLSTKSTIAAENAVDEEIIVVDDVETDEKTTTQEVKDSINIPKSLSIEEALALLPPIDPTVLEEDNTEPQCSCQLIENKTNFSIEDDEEVNLQHTFEFVEDSNCLAKTYLDEKYHLSDTSLNERVERLHTECTPSVNGNYGVGEGKSSPEMLEDGLYINVVPNVHTENLLKSNSIDYTQPASENFKKYSISENSTLDTRCGEEGVAKTDAACNSELENAKHSLNSDSNKRDSDTRVFREWHEVLETPSYDGEILKILPYVIIN